MRKYLAFVLLGVLTVAGLGGAVVGIVQGKSVSIDQAATNTLAASGYTEYLTQATAQGNETASIVYQAPDRLGGWTQSAGRRTYLFIIGTTEYISVTGSAKTGRVPLVYYTQRSSGAKAADPAQQYLRVFKQALPTGVTRTIVTTGSVTTVTLTQGAQVETLTYTVTGNYVTKFHAVIPGGTINLTISEVGTSPPVALPAGHRIVTSPTSAAG